MNALLAPQLRDLTEAEVIDLDCDTAPELFSGDEGYYFFALRSAAAPLAAIMLAGWDKLEADNKHRAAFSEEAEAMRRLLRACDRAKGIFEKAYAEKQQEVSA